MLGTALLRFCEDNDLIEPPFIAGPEDMLAQAIQRQGDHLRRHPDQTDRDWTLIAFAKASASLAPASLFPVQDAAAQHLMPSHDATRDLLGF